MSVTAFSVPAPPPPRAEGYCSRRGGAEFYDCSTQTFDRLRQSPGFPEPIRVNGMLRWRVADLIAFMERQAGQTTATRESL